MKKLMYMWIIFITLLITSVSLYSGFIYSNENRPKSRMAIILNDETILAVIKACHEMGYYLYGIRDRRVATNTSFPRSVIWYYMLEFEKNDKTKKCWLDVDLFGQEITGIDKKLKCYNYRKDNFPPSPEEVEYNFKSISTADIFGYGQEFLESKSTTGKSSLFINPKTKELKRGINWRDFNVSKWSDDNTETVFVKDKAGNWEIEFSKDFKIYSVTKL